MDLDASNNNLTESAYIPPTTSGLINIFSNYLNNVLSGNNTTSDMAYNSMSNYYNNDINFINNTNIPNYPNTFTNSTFPSQLSEIAFDNTTPNVDTSNVEMNSNIYIRFVEDLLSLPPINITSQNSQMETILRNTLHEKSAYKKILSEEGKKSINKVKYTKEIHKDLICCPITQNDFSENDKISQLPCGHIFDSSAILQWLTTEKAECPCCRFKLDSIEKKKDEVENIVSPLPRNENVIFSRSRTTSRLRNFILMQEEEDMQTALMASLEKQYPSEEQIDQDSD
jgi:hypothetical protein|tara:strand:+ start:63 stop:914 length:852 start_codon:yes stop_codon:yes gene_type:complete